MSGLKGAVLAAALLAAGFAQAQGIDCNRLAAQIASLARGGDTAGRYQAAARKQEAELARMSAYARSLRCDQAQFLFFGANRAPQCDGLNARIAQMQANLASLSQAAYDGGGARAALQQRFDAYCRGSSGFDAARGFLERLFDTNRQDRLGDDQPTIMQETPDDDGNNARGGSQAVCVRTCDGGFFPVSYSARRGSLDDLQNLCTALCPGAEAKLYTHAPGRELATSIATDGSAYSDLPNAFKFEKSFDRACSCKPPNQTWVQALADAERVLGEEHRGDIVVTQEKADELSRPVTSAPVDPKKRKFDQRAIAKAIGVAPPPVDATKAALEQEKKSADEATAAEAAAAASAPTASGDSSGIAKAAADRARLIGKSEGTRTEETDQNGVRRKVRVIAPNL